MEVSPEAEIQWRPTTPAGDIVDKLKRLNNKVTTWGDPQLVRFYRETLEDIEKLDGEKPIDNRLLAYSAESVFRQVSTLQQLELQAKLIYEKHERAATIIGVAFEEKHEKKAKEAHMKERKKAYQKALKNKGLRGAKHDKKCKEDARKETDWSWFDLKDTEHQQPFIKRELESLKGWKDGGNIKPPTPVLDRLYFCLKESGTGITLSEYVEACTWYARYAEVATQATHHTRGGPPKLRDFVNESSDVLEMQPIFDLIQAKVARLDRNLACKLISQADYDSERDIVDSVRLLYENLSLFPDKVQEVVDEAKAIRSTKEKLEQAYESELRVPSSIVRGCERYNGLLMGNPVDHALSRAVELSEY